MKSNFYSPLRYPGGKNCIFKFVSSFFYENNLIGSSYAEPYAGGAGLALRLLFEGYVDSIYINDFDRFIYSFWYTILNHNEEFCLWVEEVDVNLTNWRKFKNIQQDPDNYSSFEIAQATFFLNRTNVSGVIKGGAIGGIAQTSKYKIDARFNKKDLIHRIRKIFTLRHKIFISNLDGLDFIKDMNDKNKNIFIYLDPPYYQKGSDLYMNFYIKKDHENLAKTVRKMRQPWMVSYDNHEFILNLYPDFEKITYKLSQAASNRIGDEILIFSEQNDFKKSMLELKHPHQIIT